MKRVVAFVITVFLFSAPRQLSAVGNTDPIDPVVLKAGIDLFEAGNYTAAAEQFAAIMQRHPDDPALHFYAGVTSLKLHLYEEAIANFEATLRIWPGDVLAQTDLCQAYSEANMFEKGLRACVRASEMKPDSATALNRLGSVLFSLGQYSAAETAFKRAITLDGSLAFVHENLGETYAALNKMPQAIHAALEAVQLRPDYVKAWQSLGKFYLKIGSFRLTLDALEHARRLEPKNGKTYNFLTSAYAAKGDERRALAAAEQAAVLDPSVAVSQFNLALLYTAIGDKRRAYEARHKLEQLNPGLAQRLLILLSERYLTHVKAAPGFNP